MSSNVKTWETIEAYLEENPEAAPHWNVLQKGHRLRKGHEWQGQIKLSGGLVTMKRRCC